MIRDKVPGLVVHPSERVRKLFSDMIVREKDIYEAMDFSDASACIDYLRANSSRQHLIITDPNSAFDIAAYIKRREDPSAVVILEEKARESDPPQNIVEIADRRFRIDNIRGPEKRMYFDEIADFNHETVKIYQEQLRDIVGRLITERKLWRPLRLGFAGGGKATTGILKKLLEKPWFEKAYVYSPYYTPQSNENVPFMELLEQSENDQINRVDLDDLIDIEPDILMITTGKHRTDFSPPREQVNAEDLIPSWEKCQPIYSRISKMSNPPLTFTSTNPVESVMAAASIIYGIPKDKQFSISSDGRRLVRYAWKAIREHDPNIEALLRKKDLQLDIWGRHGAGAISISDIMMMSENLNERVPNPYSTLSFETRNRIVTTVRQAGRIIRDLAEKTGIDYEDFPRAVAEGLEDIAYMQRMPRYSWCIALTPEVTKTITGERWEDYKDAFLFLPTSIHYHPTRVSLQRGFEHKRLDTGLRDELEIQIKSQYLEVNRILKEGSR